MRQRSKEQPLFEPQTELTADSDESDGELSGTKLYELASATKFAVSLQQLAETFGVQIDILTPAVEPHETVAQLSATEQEQLEVFLQNTTALERVCQLLIEEQQQRQEIIEVDREFYMLTLLLFILISISDPPPESGYIIANLIVQLISSTISLGLSTYLAFKLMPQMYRIKKKLLGYGWVSQNIPEYFSANLDYLRREINENLLEIFPHLENENGELSIDDRNRVLKAIVNQHRVQSLIASQLPTKTK